MSHTFPATEHLHQSWGGPPGLRRASTPACSVAPRAGPGGPAHSRKPSATCGGNRRVWWRPAAGVDARPTWFSSLFVGRRPISTDLEVRPTAFRSISRHWEKYAALDRSACATSSYYVIGGLYRFGICQDLYDGGPAMFMT